MSRRKNKDIGVWHVYINGKRVSPPEGRQGWWDYNLSTVIGEWAMGPSRDPLTHIELKFEKRDAK